MSVLEKYRVNNLAIVVNILQLKGKWKISSNERKSRVITPKVSVTLRCFHKVMYERYDNQRQ